MTSTLYVWACCGQKVLTSTALSPMLVSRTTLPSAGPPVRERSSRVRLQFPEGKVGVES